MSLVYKKPYRNRYMFEDSLFKEIFGSSAKTKLLIVPAQLTLSAEQAAFTYAKCDVFFDFHVMSGNKLRAEIMNKTGGPGRTPINSLGRDMILRRIAKENADQLSVYQSCVTSSEFIKYAGDFIVQMKQTNPGGIDLAALADELAGAKGGAAHGAGAGVVTEKGPGVSAVNNERRNAVNKEKKTSVTAAAYDRLLPRKLKDMALIADAYSKVMQGKYIDSEDGLAFATSKIAECDFIKDAEIWFAGFYSFNAGEEKFLKELDRVSRGVHIEYSAPRDMAKFALPKGAETKLQPYLQSTNQYYEALSVAAEILRLIREEGYTASDIAVLSADLAVEGRLLKRVFESVGIPVFMDEKRSLMHLKAASDIAALLGMAADGVRPQTAIEFVADDDFTNYVKNYRPKGNAFLKPFRYGGEKKIAAEIKRDEFASLVGPFLTEFKTKETVREKTECIYSFAAEKLGLASKLEAEAVRLSDEGFSDSAEEMRQAWGVILSVFDQTVELAGATKLSAAEYRDMIRDAFKDIKIGLLPQKTGCISIGDLYRSKPAGVKALFITGFADGRAPREFKENGILSDAEQAELYAKGRVLCKSYKQLNKEDRAKLYEAFAAPSEKIYVCCALADVEGKSIRPSNLFAVLPDVGTTRGVEDDENLRLLLQGEGLAAEALSKSLRERKISGTELSAAEKAAMDILSDSDRLSAIKSGLLFTNEEKKLEKENLDSLLDPKYASPSGLERYAKCPFAYFVERGIKPDEPIDFTIKRSDAGTFYHELLKRIAEYLSSDRLAPRDPSSLWQTISEDALAAKVSEYADAIIAEDSSGIYEKGEEESYRSGRMKKEALLYARELVYQVRAGNIDDISCEREFTLPFAGTTIKGKIDRLDLSHMPSRDIVKVVDYKSGQDKFNEENIRRGLDLQLMIYLEYATSHGESPIGSFYFHINGEEYETDMMSLESGRLSDAVIEELRKHFMLDGFYVDEPETLSGADRLAGQGEKPVVLRSRQKRSEEAYEDLREDFRKALTENVRSMIEGDISVAPIRISKNATACTYCSYRSVCGFELTEPGFVYRK